MRILLDTHTFLWWHGERARLSAKATVLCEDLSNELFLSVASIWEIQIKAQAGKLKLTNPIGDIVELEREKNRLALLPIRIAHVLALDSLPTHHRDPFDRILVAQAQSEDLTLITQDALVMQYPIQTIW